MKASGRLNVSLNLSQSSQIWKALLRFVIAGCRWNHFSSANLVEKYLAKVYIKFAEIISLSISNTDEGDDAGDGS